MIPGLDISEEVEERIWSAFDRWSDRFKSRLAEDGVPHLIDRYRRVVESVETQSCPHGLDGALKTGRHWQFCCGITYEFDADVQCRKALRVLLEIAPPEATSEIRQEIEALDDRLYALYETPPGRTGDWWERGYPRGVVDTSIAGDWVRLPPKNPPGEGVDVLSLRRDGTFKGRFAVHRSILNGQGTYTVDLDRLIRFTRGSVTVAMPFLFKVDELILEWRDGRLLRFFYRGEPEQVGKEGPVSAEHDFLKTMYDGFNARDVDAVLAAMHPDVEWPNGWEGGWVYGHEGVRGYWTRQWQAIDPHVDPVSFDQDDLGRTVVTVHAVIRDLAGTIVSDGLVQHVYTIEDGLVRTMEIRHV